MSVLDRYLKDKRAKLSEMKKERRQTKDVDKLNKLDRSIDVLEAHIRKFMKSRMEPARVGNIVINNKVYEPFMKKLKNLYYRTTVTDEKLIVEYGTTPVKWTGLLELYDLSHYFEGYGAIKKEVSVYVEA